MEYIVDVVPGEIRRTRCSRCGRATLIECDIHITQPGVFELGPVAGTVSGCLHCDPDWSGTRADPD